MRILQVSGTKKMKRQREYNPKPAMHTDPAITFRFESAITGAEPVTANRWADRCASSLTSGTVRLQSPDRNELVERAVDMAEEARTAYST